MRSVNAPLTVFLFSERFIYTADLTLTMKVGIVEFGEENLTEIFIEAVSKDVADISFRRKKALDMFDALALTKQVASAQEEDALDQLVLIVELSEEEKDKNDAFYKGLASLEADTGRTIFKCIYMPEEGGESEIKELANTFINHLFKPSKPRGEAKEEEEAEAAIFGTEEEEGPAGPFEEAPPE